MTMRILIEASREDPSDDSDDSDDVEDDEEDSEIFESSKASSNNGRKSSTPLLAKKQTTAPAKTSKRKADQKTKQRTKKL